MTTTATATRIHLGYEMPTGEAVTVPLRHTVVTGLTQQSGKTTTCEAIVSRMPRGFKALVFRTKRGEVSFEGVNRVEPFYRQESGWEYVLSVLEAAVKQKLRVERSFIINACRGTDTLRQVYENIVQSKAQARRGFDEAILTTLEAYFEKVLPQLEENPFTQQLELVDGPNAMDLGHLSEEVQALVISSCLEEVWRHSRDTFVVIPEAWAFIPQARGNPVKWAAQHVIRQGAALGVYLLIDSQDVTGIDKAVLKSVDCWLLGRQREVNEVKRVLDQLPPSNRPSAEAVTKLGLGQFYVSTEDWCKLVYVQPAWATEEDARAIAQGEGMETVFTGNHLPTKVLPATLTVPGVEVEELRNEIARLKEELAVAVRDLISGDREREEEVHEWQQLAQSFQKQVETVLAKLQAAEAELEPWRKFREGLLAIMSVGPTSAPQFHDGLSDDDLDALADMVAAKLGAPRVVAPLEALKHQYQAEAVQRLLESIEILSPLQRRFLKWLLVVGGPQSYKDACRGLGVPEAGNSYVKFSQAANEMVRFRWLSKDGYGVQSAVREQVLERLAPYNATDEEVEQVFQHLVARLAQANAQEAG